MPSFGLASGLARSITAALRHKPSPWGCRRESLRWVGRSNIHVQYLHARAHKHIVILPSHPIYLPLSLFLSVCLSLTKTALLPQESGLFIEWLCWRGRRFGRSASPSSDWISDQYPVPRRHRLLLQTCPCGFTSVVSHTTSLLDIYPTLIKAYWRDTILLHLLFWNHCCSDIQPLGIRIIASVQNVWNIKVTKNMVADSSGLLQLSVWSYHTLLCLSPPFFTPWMILWNKTLHGNDWML